MYLDAYTQMLEQAGCRVVTHPFRGQRVAKAIGRDVLSDVLYAGVFGIDLMTLFHQDDDQPSIYIGLPDMAMRTDGG